LQPPPAEIETFNDDLQSETVSAVNAIEIIIIFVNCNATLLVLRKTVQ